MGGWKSTQLIVAITHSSTHWTVDYLASSTLGKVTCTVRARYEIIHARARNTLLYVASHSSRSRGNHQEEREKERASRLKVA